jgi:hypothetical protein
MDKTSDQGIGNKINCQNQHKVMAILFINVGYRETSLII